MLFYTYIVGNFTDVISKFTAIIGDLNNHMGIHTKYRSDKEVLSKK